MTQPITEEQLQEIERFVAHHRKHVSPDALAASYLEMLIAEVRRLRAELREAHGLLPELPPGEHYTTTVAGVVSGRFRY